MKSLILLFLTITLFQTTELEKRKILDNKIEILIPKGFQEMDAEMLNVKYKGANRPKLVYTDDRGAVNIAFSLLPNEASEEVIESYQIAIKESFETRFPTANWKADGTKTINGRKVSYLKFVSEATDQKIYNSLFITHCEGMSLIGTFNCPEKLLPQWEATSEAIIESLQIQ